MSTWRGLVLTLLRSYRAIICSSSVLCQTCLIFVRRPANLVTVLNEFLAAPVTSICIPSTWLMWILSAAILKCGKHNESAPNKGTFQFVSFTVALALSLSQRDSFLWWQQSIHFTSLFWNATIYMFALSSPIISISSQVGYTSFWRLVVFCCLCSWTTAALKSTITVVFSL